VLASGDAKNMALGANLGGLFVALTVLAVGLCLGGPSGYAINPARDLGPRIFGLLVGTKGLFDGLYWLLAPVVATIIGGVLGAYTYDWFVTPNLPAGE
ncbi:MAG: aquaporin, partial [Chloroflexi bacterium]